MIKIRLLNVLATKAGRSSAVLDAVPGLTVRDAIRDLELEEKWAQLVLLNGSIARLESELNDGDELTLSALVGGG